MLVTGVDGPSTASVGQSVRYRVMSFSGPAASAEDVAAVNWLVKTTDGGVLANLRRQGEVLTLVVPETWSGNTVFVMPFLHSPSSAISVRTAINAEERPLGPKTIDIAKRGNRYYASVDGEPAFFLGTAVRYETRRGLMNIPNAPGPLYRPEDYESTLEDWAWYLIPTIQCESKGFLTCLNTYDRARFTFGHLQFAAHTPDDNFVGLLRELLTLSAASSYFPDLVLEDGRVHRRMDAGLVTLETAKTTRRLMDYLNPTETAIDAEETDKAARFVDWCLRDAGFRERLVSFGVTQQKGKLAQHAEKLPLAGLVDKLCLVVLDILHQGRGTYAAIRSALAKDDPFDALLAIGAGPYADRIGTLRAEIRRLEEIDKVGRKVYDQHRNSFVVPEGV